MPLSYTIEGRIIRFTVVGQNNLEDLMTALTAAINDPQAGDQPVAVLVDARNSTANRSQEELRDVARFAATLRPRVLPPIAVVVSDTLHYGLTRMLSTLASQSGVDIQPFHDLQLAEDWLRETAGIE